MTACPGFGPDGPAGIAAALRTVDCLSAEATAHAFGRLFGAQAALGPALTLVLTLYVALFAVQLLTGRAALGLTMLTPRMLTLGLVLTFATSWAAYQSVVWTLAVGAPDQVASLIAGTHGSATALFADRLDAILDAVAGAASAQGGDAPKAAGFTPADILAFAALMLLLGTVGVLLVARIALAALLGVGPLFILFALFGGTRGLFEGWLKGVVLFALVPLFTVLIGGGAIAMLAPIADGLGSGPVDLRAAVTMFLAAAVYLALMAMVLKVATTIVAGWRLPGTRADRVAPAAPTVAAIVSPPAPTLSPPTGHGVALADPRLRAIVAALPAAGHEGAVRSLDRRVVTIGALPPIAPPSAAAAPAPDRARGIGSRFRAATPSFKERLS